MVDLPQGLTSLFLTYLFLLIVKGVSAVALEARVGKFILGFTLVFWISYTFFPGTH